MKKYILILFIFLFALEGVAAPKKRRIGEVNDTLYVEQLKFNNIERRPFFDRLRLDNYIGSVALGDTAVGTEEIKPIAVDSSKLAPNSVPASKIVSGTFKDKTKFSNAFFAELATIPSIPHEFTWDSNNNELNWPAGMSFAGAKLTATYMKISQLYNKPCSVSDNYGIVYVHLDSVVSVDSLKMLYDSNWTTNGYAWWQSRKLIPIAWKHAGVFTCPYLKHDGDETSISYNSSGQYEVKAAGVDSSKLSEDAADKYTFGKYNKKVFIGASPSNIVSWSSNALGWTVKMNVVLPNGGYYYLAPDTVSVITDNVAYLSANSSSFVPIDEAATGYKGYCYLLAAEREDVNSDRQGLIPVGYANSTKWISFWDVFDIIDPVRLSSANTAAWGPFNLRNQIFLHGTGEDYFTWKPNYPNADSSSLKWGTFWLFHGNSYYIQVLADSIHIPDTQYNYVYLDYTEVANKASADGSAYVKFANAASTKLLNKTGKIVLGISKDGVFYPRFAGMKINNNIDLSEIKASSVLDFTNLICIGNSITAGDGASDAAHRWVNVLETTLEAHGASITLYNQGISGNKVSQMVARTNGLARDGIVCILAGMNNIRLGLDFTSGKDDIIALINYYKPLAKLIVVGSVYPLTPYGYSLNTPHNQGTAALCENWYSGIKNLCDSLSIIYAPVYEFWNGDSTLSTDHIHPNDTGHALVASAFYQSIKAYFENENKPFRLFPEVKYNNLNVAIANKGFEEYYYQYGWTGIDATIDSITTTVHSGNSAAEVTTTAEWGGIITDYTTSTCPHPDVESGEYYVGSAWVRTVAGSDSLKIMYKEYNAANDSVGAGYGFTKLIDDSGWQLISFNVLTTATTKGMDVAVLAKTSSTVFLIDDVEIKSVDKIKPEN